MAANDAAFMAMMNNNAVLSCSGCGTGRKDNLAALNEMDKQMSMDNLTNGLNYKVSILQEEMAKKHQDADIQRTFSTFA